MINSKTTIRWAILLLALFGAASILYATAIEHNEGKYHYVTFENDPLNTRLYTLDNGFEVYMTVYKNEPRIQTAIPVKTGSKKDPADATGMAHYLEHLMFKGTDQFGTTDYAVESVEIQKIVDLFEERFHETDSAKRAELYHQIDSVSGVAAQYAIPNEYDKMQNAIGNRGTNAFTSVEQTVYINNISSNQIENWLTIESSRFRHPVNRLFHTELETVYEEKNISLDNDRRKMEEAMYDYMFKKHQYGLQTTLGSVEHLKNPSMQKVRDYFNTYYVPNNMAICVSGDFDPDEMIKMIDQKFGDFEPKEVPIYIAPVEDPIVGPIDTTVYGPSEESMRLGFRFAGSGSVDNDYIRIIDMLLNNSVAGLIDLNLNQSQKVLSAGSYTDVMQDYSLHVLNGRPREGQTLEEVKDLLLSQIDLIKKGEFPDWLIGAVINDLKLSKIRGYESNWLRVMTYVNSFTEEVPYEHYLDEISRLEKITKQDIIDFANKNYNDNYVVVYKKTGEDKTVEKITKPEITPIKLNQTDQSDFARQIYESKVEPLTPVFLDYDKDITRVDLDNGLKMYYVANNENGLFTMYYNYDLGNNNDNRFGIALNYLKYLGAGDLNSHQMKQEFYKIGCDYSVSCNSEELWVSLTGLQENFEKGVTLLEKLLNDPKPNDEALNNLKSDILKKREDRKLDKRAILRGGMQYYGMYGPKSSYTNIIGGEELDTLSSATLIDIIKSIPKYKHRVLYYGPEESSKVAAIFNNIHKVGPEYMTPPDPKQFVQLDNDKDIVYVVNYNMKQAEIIMMSKCEKYNRDNKPIRDLFNKYFGELIFYDLRESKALAYTTRGSYSAPDNPNEAHYISMYIGTQSDKLGEALKGMKALTDDLPEDEALYISAKDAILKQIQAERITKSDILFSYETSKKMANDHDLRKDVYSQLPKMTMDDILAFHDKYFKNRHFTTLVLGDTTKLDENILSQYGEIKYLTLEDIFGY